MLKIRFIRTAAIAAVVATGCFAGSASAAPFNIFSMPLDQPEASSRQAPNYQSQYQAQPQAQGQYSETSARFQRQVVEYRSNEPAGTIIIDTPNTYLYLVLGNGRAMRYGIGVGREGFTWAGTQTISKKAEWPDWTPPPEMLQRQPYLPRFMAGGPGNPLGARAMYLGGSEYRIHGTNDPTTIGHRVSSGCIRLTNDDVSDLYSRVNVGTRVIVLPMTQRSASAESHGVY